jgi:hypothetical protein
MHETVPDPSLRGQHSNLEEPTISNLGAEALGLYNSLVIELSAPVMVQVVPPRVTHHEC